MQGQLPVVPLQPTGRWQHHSSDAAFVELLRRQKPFVWRDAAFPSTRWINATRDSLRRHLERHFTQHNLEWPPSRIFATPDGMMSAYDTRLYDVRVERVRPWTRAPTGGHRTAPPHAPPMPLMEYVHVANGSRVEAGDFKPLHREVQPPSEHPQLGFRLLDPNDPADLRHTNPVTRVGERCVHAWPRRTLGESP